MVAESGKPLGELVAVMPNYPQVLINVPNVEKTRTDSANRHDLEGAGGVLHFNS
jgi:hypothetical protein